MLSTECNNCLKLNKVMASTVRATPTLYTPPAIVGKQYITGSVNSQGLPSDAITTEATGGRVGSHSVKPTVSEPPSQDQANTRVMFEQFVSVFCKLAFLVWWILRESRFRVLVGTQPRLVFRFRR